MAAGDAKPGGDWTIITRDDGAKLDRRTDVFAAGIDYVGPSSLVTLIRSFPAYWRPFLQGTWFRFVGDPINQMVGIETSAEERAQILQYLQGPSKP